MSVNIPIELVSVGISPNDGTGDSLRTSFQKMNNNVLSLVNVVSNTTFPKQKSDDLTPLGRPGDIAGMIQYDDNFLYICTKNFVTGSTVAIWKRIPLSDWS